MKTEYNMLVNNRFDQSLTTTRQ